MLLELPTKQHFEHPFISPAMAGKKGIENSRKVAGNAKKAAAAEAKSKAETAKQEAAATAEWGKGAKSNAKK
jgi:hypothetical protein